MTNFLLYYLAAFFLRFYPFLLTQFARHFGGRSAAIVTSVAVTMNWQIFGALTRLFTFLGYTAITAGHQSIEPEHIERFAQVLHEYGFTVFQFVIQILLLNISLSDYRDLYRLAFHHYQEDDTKTDILMRVSHDRTNNNFKLAMTGTLPTFNMNSLFSMFPANTQVPQETAPFMSSQDIPTRQRERQRQSNGQDGQIVMYRSRSERFQGDNDINIEQLDDSDEEI